VRDERGIDRLGKTLTHQKLIGKGNAADTLKKKKKKRAKKEEKSFG